MKIAVNPKEVSRFNNYVTRDEAEKMFEFYTRVRFAGGIKAVAKQFNRSRSTIQRLRKKYNWDERYDKIKANVQEKMDKAIENRESQNLKLARAMKTTVASELAMRLKAGTYQVTVAELIALIKLEVELSGELPVQQGDNVINIFNTIPALANDEQRQKLHGNLVKIFGYNNGNNTAFERMPERFITSDN